MQKISYGLGRLGLLSFGVLLGLMLSLTYSALAEHVVKVNLPLEDLRTFAEVFGKIKTDYVEAVEDQKLISGAINGMLTGLDPHSSYLDADSFKEIQTTTQGEFGGVGMEVGMENGFIKVVSPIEDTPAYRAGIKSGDWISKIDEVAVQGMSLNEAVRKMRGKPDTTVTLTIIRQNESSPLKFTLTRAIVKNKSVKYKLIEANYGYVRVTQFQERTGEDLANAIRAMRAENKGAFKGFVLDLRNDPGGLLNSAVGVSAAFLPKGELVVYTEGRTQDSKLQLTANHENYVLGGEAKDYLKNLPDEIKTVPMVVLINAGSASASEIVAGALQDHKRATIMGIKSFGKGSVQTIMPMNNGGAIKLTTARYFTPNGHSIQATGIVPDIVVDDGTDTASNVREIDLMRHLSNPNAGKVNQTSKTQQSNPSEKPPMESNNKVVDKKPSAPIEIASKDDLQFTAALIYLKANQAKNNS